MALGVPPDRQRETPVVFPDPRTADRNGIVAVGGNLRPETLLAAYRAGIFPWPAEGFPLLWFSPAERGILEFRRLHVSRSLARASRRARFSYSVDRAFSAVIRWCADVPRAGQQGTWITPEIRAAYVRLHELGIAHSVEVWDGRKLAGGIYGVSVDGAFSAESMFHRLPNASKLAALFLMRYLKAGGLDWMDIQVLSDHMAAMGARSVDRATFLERWQQTRRRTLRPFGDGPTSMP